jgi:hypothetical protein
MAAIINAIATKNPKEFTNFKNFHSTPKKSLKA